MVGFFIKLGVLVVKIFVKNFKIILIEIIN